VWQAVWCFLYIVVYTLLSSRGDVLLFLPNFTRYEVYATLLKLLQSIHVLMIHSRTCLLCALFTEHFSIVIFSIIDHTLRRVALSISQLIVP